MIANPPHTNGVMDLTQEDLLTIKTKLQAIIDTMSFEDTFYIVSTYNDTNELKINGDTAEFILGRVSIEGEY